MKKKIPLAILEALQPVADNNLDLTKTVKDSNSMFHLVDKDENSDFYFKVSKQEVQGGKLTYLIEFKPKNKENVNPHSAWLPIESVVTSITKWLELLQAYNKIHTIYDDPILKSNQERFEKQFEILDDDADSTSFDLEQQMFLDEYLNNVKSKLLALQLGKPENQVIELENLATEASEIQGILTKETKRQIVNRLSKLWAKAQKVGLDVIKEIFVSVTTELAKRLLTGGQ
jgi:predicted transcriptional regulator YdeE